MSQQIVLYVPTCEPVFPKVMLTLHGATATHIPWSRSLSTHPLSKAHGAVDAENAAVTP